MRSNIVHFDTWLLVILGVLITSAAIFLSQFLSWFAVVALVIIVLAFGCVIVRPTWGAIALAVLAPMSGLAIIFSRDPSWARIPYLGGVTAPVVDLVAIGVLIAIGVLLLVRPREVTMAPLRAVWPYVLVLYVCVALSVYFGDSIFFGTHVKSFLRPYLFAFVAFALPMIMLVRQKSDALRAMFAYECSAAFGAVLGAISLLIASVESGGFVRAMPLTIFGYAPFGVNHNVLAESLTAIIPFAWWFAQRQKERRLKRALYVVAALISVIALLTFSRAAWIVCAVQLALLAWWKLRAQRRTLAFALCSIAAALAIFFVVMQSTVVADSSDKTRADLLGIALTYWQRAPFFGQGPGMYVPLVGETVAFRMDYGEPMDAHGVVQKLLLEVGAIGLIAFAALIVAVAWRLWQRRTSDFHFMLFVTVVSLWGFQLFNTGYFDGKVWVLMGLAISAILL